MTDESFQCLPLVSTCIHTHVNIYTNTGMTCNDNTTHNFLQRCKSNLNNLIQLPWNMWKLSSKEICEAFIREKLDNVFLLLLFEVLGIEFRTFCLLALSNVLNIYSKIAVYFPFSLLWPFAVCIYNWMRGNLIFSQSSLYSVDIWMLILFEALF